MARKVNPEAQKSAMAALIAAGICAINTEGVDQISVQSVSNAARTSRPTFYSYFGDINGMLAEIWLAHADRWLSLLSDLSTPLSSLTEEEQSLNTAMSEILASSHRIPEVAELVQPKLEAWCHAQNVSTDTAKLKIIWLIASRLGATLTAPIDREVESLESLELIFASIPDDDTLKDALPKIVFPEVADLDPTAEDLDEKLLASTIQVIASSGVKATSMARVARKTQVSTGALYPRFSKIEELIDSSFETAVTQIVKQNFTSLDAINFNAAEFGAFVMAGLQPSRETWRNFRIEIHLAARVRPTLAKRLSKNIKQTNDLVALRIATAYSITPVPPAIPFLVHCIGVGLAMLQNGGVNLVEFDHRLITKPAVAKLLSAN